MAKSTAAKKSVEIEDDGLNALSAMSVEQGKKTAKKDDKITIQVRDKEVATAIDKMAQAKKDKADAEQRIKDAEGIIKPFGLKTWLHEVSEGRKIDNSFILATVNTAKPDDVSSIMYGTKDAYEKIDAERAKVLIEKYGPEIVTKTTSISINANVIGTKVTDPKSKMNGKSMGAVLAALIANSPDIPADLKSQLLISTPQYTVTKGTVEDLKKIVDAVNEEAEEPVTVKELFMDIMPQQFLKGVNEK